MTENHSKSSEPTARKGDSVQIPGDYQHRALTEGPRVQRFWHRSKLELIDWAYPMKPGESVVDVGCGSGVFADQMARRGAKVVGVDANADAVEYSTKTFGRAECKFMHGYLDELEFPDDSFDAATCMEVVEHVYPDQVDKLLGDLHRILRPGGRILVTTPNYRGTWPVVEYLADRAAATAKMDAEQHVTRFHRRMLRRHIESAGFRVDRIRTYCTFAPFLAALWWQGAQWCDRAERRLNLPFGNILVAVATKPE